MDAPQSRSGAVGDADKPTQRLIEHEELRDIHSRIDALQHETQSNHRDLTSKLHSLEVAVARGSRFPAAAWVAAASIVLSVVGTGGVLFSKLEAADEHATKALNLIEQHQAGSSGRWQNIERCDQITRRWDSELPALTERVRSLEARIVGQGPNGWHRSDHEEYAKRVEAEMEILRKRLDVLERGRK